MRRSGRRDHILQLDLFHPPRNGPEWHGLPMEVREQTMLLLAQMLRMSPVSLMVREGAVESQRAAGDE